MNDVEFALEDFIKKRKKPFSLIDLRKTLPLSFVLDDYLTEYLCTHPHVFHNEGMYISRCGIFTNQKFSIAPLAFERRDNVLLIGHRCTPFVNPEVFSFDITFMHKGAVIPKKTIAIHTQKALEFYSFFGQEYALDFFANDPANVSTSFLDREGVLPTIINITVLDMQELYQKWNFRRGDRIAATIIDWQKSVVEIEPLFSKCGSHLIGSEEDHSRRYWMDLFEKTLLESNTLNGPCESIEEQLANVFVYEGDKLFTHHGASVEEAIQHATQIVTCEYGVETRLWKQEEEIPVIVFDEEYESDIRFLDIIWGANNATLPEVVINALLYDSLYKKESSVFPLVERMLKTDSLNDAKNVQEVVRQLEEHRDTLSKTYNWFGDFEKAKLREQILKLYVNIFDFVCTVDSATDQLQELPQSPLIILTQLHGHLLFMLNSLAPDRLEVVSEYDIDLFYQSLDGMINSFDDIKENLTFILDSSIRKRFFVL